MIYRTISVKRIIAKVFTDLDLKEGDHRVSDMISWAGSALLKIGAFPQFINKIAGKGSEPLIPLVNYQAKLPGDFYKLIQVAYSATESGPFYPMRYATGSYDAEGTLETISDVNEGIYPESNLVNLTMDTYSLSYVDALSRLNTEPATKDLMESYLVLMEGSSTKKSGGDNLTTFSDDYTFMITPNWIKTNQQIGYLLMSYQALPVDKDGYPLVPDDESFSEAIYWYINMKLMYPEWKEGRVRDAVYYDSRRSWNFYCKQAYGNAMMPDSEKLESIKNAWLRLAPTVDEHDSFYSTLGQRQIIYNANA